MVFRRLRRDTTAASRDHIQQEKPAKVLPSPTRRRRNHGPPRRRRRGLRFRSGDRRCLLPVGFCLSGYSGAFVAEAAGVACCCPDVVPAEDVNWGSVKSLYR